MTRPTLVAIRLPRSSSRSAQGARLRRLPRGRDPPPTVYYGARWYDPVVGRFLQADTIVPSPGNPQSLNRYSYVLNNPLRYKDPSGHKTCEAAGLCPIEDPLLP